MGAIEGSEFAQQYGLLWTGGEEPPDIFDFLRRNRRSAAKGDLLAVLLVDQRERFARGLPCSVEFYSESLPKWLDYTEARLGLAIGEFRHQASVGVAADEAGFAKRFPELGERLLEALRGISVVAKSPPEPGSELASSSDSNLETRAVPVDGQAGSSVEPELEGVPRQVGRFWIEKRLASGGYGTVYLAHDEDLHRPVAMKVPHRLRLEDPEAYEAFLAEARAIAQLDHQGIVPILEFGRMADGRAYIVEKYIPGEDLRSLLLRKRFKPQEAAALVARVSEALHHCHEQGLVHRDVKPGNILIDPSGRPLLTDFGLAQKVSELSVYTARAGTLLYMSPEQARGEGHLIDRRSDLFSVGVVFYELLTGRRPFDGGSPEELVECITRAEAIPPGEIDDRIPPELERVCLRALSKRAAHRFATAYDLANDLRLYLSSETSDTAAAGFESGGPPEAAALHTDSLRVVPKGLRAFDSEDATFFLALLPGPSDRQGTPERLRFWLRCLAERDPDATFRVGLIYGPSGSGKSSFLKAGLLPRLDDRLVAIYAESTAAGTEERLLRVLRRRCPGVPEGDDLPQAIARIRRGEVLPAGQKLVLVVDQFEQWLHAHDDDPAAELVAALRQCDGGRVQCVLSVRDDFWMAVTRFFDAVEVPLSEGRNSAAVDLFDRRHAQTVLRAFGVAFGALPGGSSALTEAQRQFIEQAVDDLAREGRVVAVRLALFAEMVKGREWSPPTLRELGGARGLGVKFLEETFGSPATPPEYRVHARALRAVLQRLLPDQTTQIKGQVRTRGELVEAAGYAARPRDFDRVLRILDQELRLLTPADPIKVKPDGETVPGLESPYQLTHDELVPMIRAWLTQKQRETRAGRAALLLQELAEFWNAKPVRGRLPTLLEFTWALVLTRVRHWSRPERRMMMAATRLHALHAIGMVAALVGLIAGERIWTDWRVQDLVGSARNAWSAGSAEWSQACAWLEKAYQIQPGHRAVEALFREMGERGALTLIADHGEEVEIRLEARPGESVKLGLALHPEILRAQEVWRPGESIPVALGHYWVELRRGEQVVGFPWFVSQTVFKDAGPNWSLAERLVPDAITSWEPSGVKNLTEVRFAETVELRVELPEAIPDAYVYIPEGPYWRTTEWSSGAKRVVAGPPDNEWCEMTVVTPPSLVSDTMESGFLIAREEVSARDFHQWYEATREARREWLVESRLRQLLAQVGDAPIDTLRILYREALEELAPSAAVSLDRESICRAAVERELRLGNWLGYDDKLGERVATQVADDAGQPVRWVNLFYAQDYAWTHQAVSSEDFESWLKDRIAARNALLGRLSLLIRILEQESILLPLDRLPRDVLLPHFDENFHEFRARTLHQEYYDWLAYDLLFLHQLPAVAVLAWSETFESELGPELRTSAARLEGLQSDSPWSDLGQEHQEMADLLRAYSKEIQHYEWKESGKLDLLPSEYLGSSGERWAKVPLERDHLVRWLRLRFAGLEQQNGMCQRCLDQTLRNSSDAEVSPDLGIPWELRLAYGAACGWSIPTIGQWEKAFRGVDTRMYPWGNGLGFANIAGNVGKPVAAHAWALGDDLSPYGILSLAGNVSEWILWPEPLKTARREHRDYLKGGNWFHDEGLSRASSLMHVLGYHNGLCIGFRPVRSLAPSASGFVNSPTKN